MAIVSFSKNTIIDYVPEYGGNRESSTPCVISLKYLSFGELREHQRLLAAKSKGARDQEKSMAIAQALQREQFVNHVVTIRGYLVDDVEVSDPNEFYDSAPVELITEILEAMQDSHRLNEGQQKNS